jgi:hypothetical protein
MLASSPSSGAHPVGTEAFALTTSGLDLLLRT